jgi:rod shape determining protein RodA
MTPFLRKLLGQNWLLLVTTLALAIFGVVAIYSATSTRSDAYAADFWRKQANWVVVGTFAFMLTSLVHYRWIRWGALPMYLAGIVFLIMTKFIGVKVYGARSWLHLGPINFQPAQLAVVAGIMVLALFLTQFRDMHPMLRLLLSGAIAAAPCLLILMQPDLGETIIWGPVLLTLLFVGGLPLRYLICVILIVIAFIPIAINFGLKPYQQQRITAFTHPDIDKQGSAWAINQSLIAIGSGGWSGKGFKAPNTQIELGFLPATAVHNDYIFSAIGEQWGFVGGILIISAFALLLMTCLFVAFFAGDQLGLLLVIGIAALIFTTIFQNIGMTIALLPITGVPCPLISYSGSFVLMIMFGLGLVNSVWIHRKIPA